MPRRKKPKNIQEDGDLAKQIRKFAKGVYYTSETDAKISLFVGKKAQAVTKEVLLSQTAKSDDVPVEERDFEEFFSPLTKTQDWFGDEEKQATQKFSGLKVLLEKNLKDLKVFKIGQIELDIYIVGLDEKSILTGIKTKAVET